MRLLLTRNEILSLARRYLELPSYDAGVSNGVADRLTERKIGAAFRRGNMVSDDLRAVARWKYPGKRLINLIGKNTPEEVTEITRVSFSATSERLRVGALLALHGVGWPMASAILHFAFPGHYPMLDVRVMRTIDGPRGYTFDRWIQFTEFCLEASVECGVTMRDLDRALWTHDYICTRNL